MYFIWPALIKSAAFSKLAKLRLGKKYVKKTLDFHPRARSSLKLELLFVVLTQLIALVALILCLTIKPSWRAGNGGTNVQSCLT